MTSPAWINPTRVDLGYWPGASPVEAYIGIKGLYQGILGEYLGGRAYQALTSSNITKLM
jgi:hypothetical protein